MLTPAAGTPPGHDETELLDLELRFARTWTRSDKALASDSLAMASSALLLLLLLVDPIRSDERVGSMAFRQWLRAPSSLSLWTAMCADSALRSRSSSGLLRWTALLFCSTRAGSTFSIPLSYSIFSPRCPTEPLVNLYKARGFPFSLGN
ncbi:hypothetical protein MPTK2_4g16830 [Marchantia polymorpha subsp. ruderalis]